MHVRKVVSGLSTPTAMAFIGLRDILVLQKNDGRVRRVTNGVLQGDVLDVHVDTASERGLLGIAVQPNFPATSSVHLYYTQSRSTVDSSGSPRLERQRSGGAAIPRSAVIGDLNCDGSITFQIGVNKIVVPTSTGSGFKPPTE